MSTYKQFTSKDVIITPFNLGKRFAYTSTGITATDVEIDFFQGINDTTRFDDGQGSVLSLNSTGLLNEQYKALVYNDIKQLYYTNYLPNNDAQYFAQTSSYFIGTTDQNHRYENYLASLTNETRYFPTESNAEVTVISIPSKCYGNSIRPNSFAFTYGTTTITDDGNGNITIPEDTTFSEYGTAKYGINIYGKTPTPKMNVGNIIYSHGIIIITSGSLTGLANTISSSYATNIQSASISFESDIQIYENQYKCTFGEDEFNFSLNPSNLSGSNVSHSGSALSGYSGDSDTVFNFTTGSSFSPYITTVGLYNNMQELIAIGKLSQPLQSSRNTDTTLLVNFDT
jgi:hypothetical protein